jgi:hypothetical protein
MFGKVITEKVEFQEFINGYIESFENKSVISNVPVTMESLRESDKVIAYYRKGEMKAGFVFNKGPRRCLITLSEEQIRPYRQELFNKGTVEPSGLWKKKSFSPSTVIWCRIFFETMISRGRYMLISAYPRHGMYQCYTQLGATFLDVGEGRKRLAVFFVTKNQFIQFFFWLMKVKIKRILGRAIGRKKVPDTRES